MRDLLLGHITYVIDHESFGLEVIQAMRSDNDDYDAREKIRIRKLDMYYPSYAKAFDPMTRGREFLHGRGVMCLVNCRSYDGYLESDVIILI